MESPEELAEELGVLFSDVGYTPEVQRAIKRRFESLCSRNSQGEQLLTLGGFRSLLRGMNSSISESAAADYFRAIDADCDTLLRFEELLVALACADTRANHRRHMKRRLGYIFRCALAAPQCLSYASGCTTHRIQDSLHYTRSAS